MLSVQELNRNLAAELRRRGLERDLPHSSIYAEDWADELGELPSTGTGTPWLLAGDFDATLGQRVMRDVLGRGYRDAAAATGSGPEPTWPNNRRLPPLIAIDHVLADERIGIEDFGVEGLPRTDHRAVFATVFLPPTR